jgi:hypothetical protein
MTHVKYIAVLLIFIVSQLALAQDIPSVEDLSVDQEFGGINSSLDSVPDRLDDDLIPTETATQLFSYIKWAFSDSSANELVGVTLAPILLNLYLLLLLAVTFTILWLTIRMLILGWRLILFIIGWIIRLIELIPFFQ